jgi:plastocyanin
VPEDQPDLFDKLFELLQALIMPVWNDLILLIPIVLIVIVVIYLIFTARQWRRAGPRNRPRLMPRMAGTPPPGVHTSPPSRWPFVAPIGLTLLFLGLVLPPRDAAGHATAPVNVTYLVLGLLVSAVAFIGWLREAMREWRQTALAADGGVSHAVLAPGLTPTALPSGTFRARPVPAQLALVPVSESSVAVMEPPAGVHMPGPSPWPFFAPIALAIIFFGLIFSPFLIIAGVILGAIAAGGWLRDANREWRSTENVGHAVPATLDPVEAWPRRVVRLFKWVIVVSLVLALIPAFGDWLGSLRPAAASPTPLAVPAKPEIAASTAVSFETKTLIVPAGRPFELTFHNKQAGTPHNVVIANGADRATVFFDGEVVTGVTDVTYQVPALQAGDYYFLCKVHPNMNGSVQARPETGTGGGPQGSPAPGASPSGGSPVPGASPSGGSPSP